MLARSLGTHRFVAPAAALSVELTPPLLPVGFGPVSLGLGCFAVWCCDGMNSTVVDFNLSTVVDIAVEIFVEVAESHP